MNIVIDTNVVMSAMFFGGKPRILLELLVGERLDAFVTEDIVSEYQETADELCSRYPGKPVKLPLAKIISACTMIEKKSKISVCRDPDDNKFIECAVDGDCIFIVSGDKDLLSIQNYVNIEIVTVAEFLSRFQE